MALLKREEWQGFVRDVDWTPTYVDDEAIYPEWHIGTGKVPREAWLDVGGGLQGQLPRVRRDPAGEGGRPRTPSRRRCSARTHSTTSTRAGSPRRRCTSAASRSCEYAAVLAELKMARFGLERRVAQHGRVRRSSTRSGTPRSPRSSATSSSPRTRSTTGRRRPSTPTTGSPIALRNLFDGMMIAPNVVDLAIAAAVHVRDRVHQPAVRRAGGRRAGVRRRQLRQHDLLDPDRRGPALPAGRPDAGDPRRARPGPRPVGDRQERSGARPARSPPSPGPRWTTTRRSSTASSPTGSSWRSGSSTSSSARIEDYGLKKPWYWDEFMQGLDTWHHALHMGLWYWRPTLWWKPEGRRVARTSATGCRRSTRTGRRSTATSGTSSSTTSTPGNIEATLPETLPWLCSTCHLPCCNATQSRSTAPGGCATGQLDYDGKQVPLLHQRLPTDLLEGPRQRQPRHRDRPLPGGPDPADGRRRHPRLHGPHARRHGRRPGLHGVDQGLRRPTRRPGWPRCRGGGLMTASELAAGGPGTRARTAATRSSPTDFVPDPGARDHRQHDDRGRRGGGPPRRGQAGAGRCPTRRSCPQRAASCPRRSTVAEAGIAPAGPHRGRVRRSRRQQA